MGIEGNWDGTGQEGDRSRFKDEYLYEVFQRLIFQFVHKHYEEPFMRVRKSKKCRALERDSLWVAPVHSNGEPSSELEGKKRKAEGLSGGSSHSHGPGRKRKVGCGVLWNPRFFVWLPMCSQSNYVRNDQETCQNVSQIVLPPQVSYLSAAMRSTEPGHISTLNISGMNSGYRRVLRVTLQRNGTTFLRMSPTSTNSPREIVAPDITRSIFTG